MSDETVLITGCTSGVGLHLADAFLKRGYRVAATARSAAKLEALADEHGWSNDRIQLLELDVRKSEDWALVLEVVTSRWHRVDLFLNVAGYLLPGYIHETPEAEIDKHIDTNVKGVMVGARRVARQMIAQGGGHVINIGSVSSLMPIVGLGLYSASKFAVRAFSIALAEELKPHGVAVSLLCPGPIETPMLSRQENHPEAALSFSDRALKLEEIEAALFDRIIPRAPIEYALPWGQTTGARLLNLWPSRLFWLERILRRRGKARQQRRQHKA